MLWDMRKMWLHPPVNKIKWDCGFLFKFSLSKLCSIIMLMELGKLLDPMAFVLTKVQSLDKKINILMTGDKCCCDFTSFPRHSTSFSQKEFEDLAL